MRRIAHICAQCGRLVPPGKGCCESKRKNQRPTRSVYASKRWRELRARVLDRDRWRCQECGARATTVAHIQPFRDASDPLAWDDSNLRAECASCNSREASHRWHASRREPTPPDRRPPLDGTQPTPTYIA